MSHDAKPGLERPDGTRSSPFKIVVTGSHGVGKTSLVDALADDPPFGCTVGVIPETARTLVQEGYEVNDRMSMAGFLRYTELFLERIRTARGELVVADRSLVDLRAYTEGSPFIGREAASLLDELIRHENLLVDEYVYVPVEYPVTPDAVRPADPDYQRLIDGRVVATLEACGSTVFKVTGSLTERLRQLRERYGRWSSSERFGKA